MSGKNDDAVSNIHQLQSCVLSDTCGIRNFRYKNYSLATHVVHVLQLPCSSRNSYHRYMMFNTVHHRSNSTRTLCSGVSCNVGVNPSIISGQNFSRSDFIYSNHLFVTFANRLNFSLIMRLTLISISSSDLALRDLWLRLIIKHWTLSHNYFFQLRIFKIDVILFRSCCCTCL